MSTSCYIAAKIDGKIYETRINWDGYPEYVGHILANCYTPRFQFEKDISMIGKIKYLINKGEIKVLHYTPGKTIYYEDTTTKSKVYDSIEEWLLTATDRRYVDYQYYIDLDGFNDSKWHYFRPIEYFRLSKEHISFSSIEFLSTKSLIEEY